MLRRIFVFIALLVPPSVVAQTTHAQTMEPVVHTLADLQEWEAKATEAAKANPTGFGVSRLDDYGNDYTLLVVRLRTGEAERHQFFSDEIVMLKGTIILVVGGTMQGEHANNGPGRPGETIGSSVAGGKAIVLHTGEIAHIPAGIPHWVKVPADGTAVYLIFKER